MWSRTNKKTKNEAHQWTPMEEEMWNTHSQTHIWHTTKRTPMSKLHKKNLLLVNIYRKMKWKMKNISSFSLFSSPFSHDNWNFMSERRKKWSRLSVGSNSLELLVSVAVLKKTNATYNKLFANWQTNDASFGNGFEFDVPSYNDFFVQKFDGWKKCDNKSLNHRRNAAWCGNMDTRCISIILIFCSVEPRHWRKTISFRFLLWHTQVCVAGQYSTIFIIRLRRAGLPSPAKCTRRNEFFITISLGYRQATRVSMFEKMCSIGAWHAFITLCILF